MARSFSRPSTPPSSLLAETPVLVPQRRPPILPRIASPQSLLPRAPVRCFSLGTQPSASNRHRFASSHGLSRVSHLHPLTRHRSALFPFIPFIFTTYPPVGRPLSTPVPTLLIHAELSHQSSERPKCSLQPHSDTHFSRFVKCGGIPAPFPYARRHKLRRWHKRTFHSSSIHTLCRGIHVVPYRCTPISVTAINTSPSFETLKETWT